MRKVATHINPATGEPCGCGFDKFSEPLDVPIEKTAGSKLDWIKDRQDKFFKTPEGEKLFRQLEHLTSNAVGKKLDALVPWIWREAKKGRLPYEDGRTLVPASYAQLDHMADWFASNSATRRGVDIMQLNWDQMEGKMREWDDELASKKSEEAANALGGTVVHDVGDGWTIKQITTKEEAKAEGDMMGHCVGGYGTSIENGSTLVYSLRDPKNGPHATIEINPSNNVVMQIQGKSNTTPIEEYQEMVGNWLINMENPPSYEQTVELFHLYAPNTVEELYYYMHPYEEDYVQYEYETNFIDNPENWYDYFNQDHEYGEYETREIIEPIENENWEHIVGDFFFSISDENENGVNEKTDKLLTIIADAGSNRIDVNPFYEEVLEAVVTHVYPHFQYRYYDPTNPKPLTEQWKEFPQSRAIDAILGSGFIEDMEHGIPPIVNPDPTGPIPGQMSTDDITADKLLPEEMDPRDPNSIDKAANVFKKFANRFRRKTNILDKIYECLQPDVWDDAFSPRPILKPEISQWIQTFITDALARHGYTDMDSWLSLVLTGSLTSYQYSDNSDCDISLFVDAESFPDWSRAEMIGIMMEECDEVRVPGTTHELQCYVVSNDLKREDLYKPGLRSAYDLATDKWIVAPDKNSAHDVMREMNEASTIALENADKMEKLIRYEPLKAIQFYNQMHRRRRTDMLAGKGDFSPSNISYKMLNQRGLDKQVYALMQQYN